VTNHMLKMPGRLPITLTTCAIFLIMSSFMTPPAQAQSQNEMNMTAARDFAKADARLNRVYKQILSGISETATRRKLVASEKAWIAYRDAQGHFEASAAAEGGSMYPMVFSGTCARLTEERIKQLKQATERP